MTGHGEKLSRQQEQAIVALLGSSSVQLAAQAAGVSERTLRRWLQRGDFAAQYRRARAGMLEAAVGELQRAATDAADVLRRLAKDRHTPPQVQAGAARTLLDMAFRGATLIDLAERVTAVEQSLERMGGGDTTVEA